MESITFNKSDLTLIADEDLTAIQLALSRYLRDMKQGKVEYAQYIIDLQIASTERMIEYFNHPSFLATPYFPIDEND
jgi:hypothetical protein